MNDRTDEAIDESAQPPLVLIVDDEVPIAEALAVIIEDAGYIVACATRSRAALELVQAGVKPALIVTDLMMPEMDGAKLIEALRIILGAAMPPVVLATAAGPRYATAVAADAFLPKPFNLTEVEDLLARFLCGG